MKCLTLVIRVFCSDIQFGRFSDVVRCVITLSILHMHATLVDIAMKGYFELHFGKCDVF